jgi:prolyl-tRNA synthetase
MKLSQSLSQTSKTVAHDADSVNAKLLTQAGFIKQEAAGVYSYLPFGRRVLAKIEQIVREEMNQLLKDGIKIADETFDLVVSKLTK